MPDKGQASAALRTFIDASAGGVGSLLTSVLVYPVDVAKTQIQSGSSKDDVLTTLLRILNDEGVVGLFKGLGPKAVHTTAQNFIYFYVYAWLKERHAALGYRPSTAANTAMGVLAGCANLTLTLPLETVVVRQQTQTRREGEAPQSAAQVVAELWRTGGLWKGHAPAGGKLDRVLPLLEHRPRALQLGSSQSGPQELARHGLRRAKWRTEVEEWLPSPARYAISCVLTLNPALTNSIFDMLKARYLALLARRRGDGGARQRSLSTAQSFVLGSFAKVIATLLTYRGLGEDVVRSLDDSAQSEGTGRSYPLVRLKVTQQAQGAQGQTTGTIPQIARQILAQEGAVGLYRGCQAQIGTAVTKSGILLATKEQLFRYTMLLILMSRGRHKLPAAAA